ncbi:MAG: nucleotidyltransferase substrate binding protein [Deltaproteobacteria bacterium]|nr:nucleotidyltransferase substrate binding protein [Deltaproteobacteria bacterium]
MNKNIRWIQRFDNFKKAFIRLTDAVDRKEYDELSEAGLIQTFEFTFELAWKTLKDYLESKGTIAKLPRDVIKVSFQNSIIEDGETWIDMLEKRNLLSHAYDEKTSRIALSYIKNNYFEAIKQVFDFLKNEL